MSKKEWGKREKEEKIDVGERLQKLEEEIQELKDSIYKVSNDLSQRVWTLERAIEIVVSKETEWVDLADGSRKIVDNSVKVRKALLLLLDHFNLKIEKSPEKVSIIEVSEDSIMGKKIADSGKEIKEK